MSQAKRRSARGLETISSSLSSTRNSERGCDLTCDVCHEKFTIRASLLLHKRDKSCMVQTLHTCGTCRKTFSSQTSLSRHTKVHSTPAEKAERLSAAPLAHVVCATSFRTNFTLSRHDLLRQSSGDNLGPPRLDRRNVAKKGIRGVKAGVTSGPLSRRLLVRLQDGTVTWSQLQSMDPLLRGRPYVKLHTGASVPLNPSKTDDTPGRPTKRSQKPSSQQKKASTSTKNLSKHRTIASKRLICKFNFSSNVERKKHLYFHCNVCYRKFNSKTCLKYHIIRFHQHELAKKCRLCNKSFDTHSALQQHILWTIHKMSSDSTQFPISCFHCARVFHNKRSLVWHLKQMHFPTKRYICKICDTWFLKSWSRTKHMRIAHGAQTVLCQYCGVYFPNSRAPKSHVCQLKGTRNSQGGESETLPEAEDDKCIITVKVGEDTDSVKNVTQPILMATNSAGIECSKCGAVVMDCLALRDHNYKFHGSGRQKKVHVCHLCDQEFKRPLYLKRHIEAIHTKEPSVTCPVCDRKLKNRQGLRSHMSIYHTGKDAGKKFVCLTCDKEFSIRNSLDRHNRFAHGTDSDWQKCSYCSKVLKNVRTLHWHINKNHPDAPKPNKKKETFTVKIVDDVGREIVTSVPTLLLESRAPEIGEEVDDPTSPDPVELNDEEQHIASEEVIPSCKDLIQVEPNNWPPPVKCAFCSKSFGHKHDLAKHMSLQHFFGRHFCCDLCDKRFSTRDFLSRHTEVAHSAVKPQQCTHCPEILRDKRKLQVHLSKIHNIASFECAYCSQSFRSRGNLNLHEEHVHKAAPRKCPHCDKILKHAISAKSHIKTFHPWSKEWYTFTCAKCHQGFEKYCDLREHMWNIHGIEKKLFPCLYCIKILRSSTNLREHIWRFHKNEMGTIKKKKQTNNDQLITFTMKERVSHEVIEQNSAHTQVLDEAIKLLEDSIAENNKKSGVSKIKSSHLYCSQTIFVEEHRVELIDKDKRSSDIDPPAQPPSLPTLHCNECNKMFKHKGHLKRHIVSQHGAGARPMACQQCGKRCKNSSALTNHVSNYHTGAVQGIIYRCPVCGMEFQARRNALAHLRQMHMHGREPLPCGQCDAVLSTKKCLVRHVAKWHPNPTTPQLSDNS